MWPLLGNGKSYENTLVIPRTVFTAWQSWGQLRMPSRCVAAGSLCRWSHTRLNTEIHSYSIAARWRERGESAQAATTASSKNMSVIASVETSQLATFCATAPAPRAHWFLHRWFTVPPSLEVVCVEQYGVNPDGTHTRRHTYRTVAQTHV